MRGKRYGRAAVGALALVLAGTLAGCLADDQQTEPQITPTVSSSVSTPVVETVTGHPSPSPSAQMEEQSQEKQAVAANMVQQASAAESKTSTATDASAAKSVKVFDTYTVDKPLLMGIAIGESKDKTVQLHGEPESKYVMEDDADPIAVFEYESFIVGFNQKQQVEFVEVTSDDADPGLNGLRLGQTTAKASEALGKPDASTDFVLTYKTKETILKLDIDPKSKSILSIKLFRRIE